MPYHVKFVVSVDRRLPLCSFVQPQGKMIIYQTNRTIILYGEARTNTTRSAIRTEPKRRDIL